MNQLNIFNNQKINIWELYIDGASRKNPGDSGIGIYLTKNNDAIVKNGYFIGTKTNNQAEYLAFIIGLLIAQKLVLPNDKIIIYSDSKLLVEQICGNFSVKNPSLIELHKKAVTLLQNFNWSIKHILRNFNKVADQLANEGIDKKILLPNELKNLWHNLYEN